MNVGFDGLLRTEATFETINPIAEGTEEFNGIVTKDEDRFVSVQIKGYMEVSYDGDAPAYGRAHIKSTSDANAVTVSETDGVEVTVLYVDTVNSVVGFIL